MTIKAHYGDIIKIVDAMENAEYKNGDVFEVDMRASYMGACDDDTIMTTCEKVIWDTEYEILEYNSPIHAKKIVSKYLAKSNEQLLSDFKWGSEGVSAFNRFMNNLRRLLENDL